MQQTFPSSFGNLGHQDLTEPLTLFATPWTNDFWKPSEDVMVMSWFNKNLFQVLTRRIDGMSHHKTQQLLHLVWTPFALEPFLLSCSLSLIIPLLHDLNIFFSRKNTLFTHLSTLWRENTIGSQSNLWHSKIKYQSRILQLNTPVHLWLLTENDQFNGNECSFWFFGLSLS